MLLNKLTAISPVDGRYRNQTEKLADYFSEYALIRYRIRVEVEYFIALCELPLPELSGVEKSKFEALRALYLDFSEAILRKIIGQFLRLISVATVHGRNGSKFVQQHNIPMQI